MERFPEKISAAVFANALMPGPALPYLTVFDKVTTYHIDPYFYLIFFFILCQDRAI